MDEEVTPLQKLRKSTISMLRAILASNAKIGVPMHLIGKEYEEMTFQSLQYQEMGYHSIEQFLRDIPEVCYFERASEGFTVVKGIPSHEDKHVFKLVADQKMVKKKQKKSSLSLHQVNRRGGSNLLPRARKPVSTRHTISSYDNNRSGRSLTSYRVANTSRVSREANTSIHSRGGYRNVTRDVFVPPRWQQPIIISISSDEEDSQSRNRLTSSHRFPVPSSSTPNVSLTPKDLLLLGERLKILLRQRPSGLWARRIHEDFKSMFNEELPSDILKIIQDHFLDFIRIESPATDRHIISLVKEPSTKDHIFTPDSARNYGSSDTPNLKITAISAANNDLVSTDIQQNGKLVSSARLVEVSRVSEQPLIFLRSASQVCKIDTLEFPEPGTSIEAYVCHIESLERFFIQFADSKIYDLVLSMQQFYEAGSNSLPLGKPRLGEYCCARYSLDKSWFRAKILTLKEQKNIVNESYRCRVMYVDYGNDETVISTELKQLAPQFYELPVQAVQCCLFGVVAVSEDSACEENAIQLFRDLTTDVKLKVVVREKIGNVLAVELYDENDRHICSQLALAGKARRITTSDYLRSSSISPESKTRSSLQNNAATEPSEKIVCWADLQGDDDYYEVTVSYIISTRDVYLVRLGLEHYKKLEQLESLMDEYYDNGDIPPARDPVVGLHYAACCDGSWRRITLLEVNGEDYTVFLVDQGNKSIVSKDDIKDLLTEYYGNPFQAIYCTMNKVAENFDSMILQYFSEVALEKPCIARVMERPTGECRKFSIELYNNSADQPTCINVELKARIDAENHLQPTLPDIGAGTAVAFITDITGEGEFFIQIDGPGLEQLQSITQDINVHFSQPVRAQEILSKPEVGAICCAKFGVDNCWYRAEIKEVMEAQRQVKVKFIDYGNESVIQMLLVRKPTAVSEKVITLPPQMVKCKADGLIRCDTDMQEKLKVFINNYVDYVLVELVRLENELPVVKFYVQESDDQLTEFFEKYKQVCHSETASENDLTDSNLHFNKLNTSVANNTTFENISLLAQDDTLRIGQNSTLSEWDVVSSDSSPEKQTTRQRKHVEQRKQTILSNISEGKLSSVEANNEQTTARWKASSQNPCTTYSPSWGIPGMPITDKFIEVVVEDVISPSNFTIIPISYWPQLETMHAEMLQYYGNFSGAKVRHSEVGDVCAAYHEEHELWYRATIQDKVDREHQLVVKYPDFGSSLDLIKIELVQPLHEKFRKLPFLAIHCSLADVVSMDGGHEWSKKATARFVQSVRDQTLLAEVVTHGRKIDKDKPLCVKLHGASAGNKRFVVNDQLVVDGFAKKIE